MSADRLLVADRVVGAPSHGSALLIRNGKVEAIDAPDVLRRNDLPEDRFGGGTIVPGLRDAHIHPVGYTAALNRLVVKNAADFDELVILVREAAADLPPGETVIGIRLDDDHLAEGRLPTRTVLDAAVTDRPAIVYRYCGHLAVVNTAALEEAGIGPNTPDPFGGSFDRDENGAPNGILRENAVALVGDMCGDRSGSLTPSNVAAGSRHLASLGLTSVGAMVAPGPGLWADAQSELDLMVDAAPELAITMNTLVMTTDVEALETAKDRIDRSSRRLRFLGVKVIADGSLGGRTAAMDDGYSDKPGERGMLRVTRGETLTVSRRSIALGGMVAIHAIGDAANAFVLNIFATLRDEGAPDGSLRLEHASVLRPADIKRVAELGVIASVQPAFIASEQDWLRARLGERIERAYPFASLAAAGAVLAGGSDCPVEPPHPLWGMAAAVDRGVISPSQSLTGSQALEMFTAGAARAMREPEPLAIGSPADITVLDHDPTTAAPGEIRRGGVMATFVEGEEREPEPGEAWKG